MRGGLHAAIDRFAIRVEDRRALDPEPFHDGPREALGCYGALPPLPPAPGGPGPWSAPSPLAPGERMALVCHAARGARRGTVLLVPPWKLPSAALVRGWIALAVRAGWDAWLVVPPHHLDRAAGARSGVRFVSLDLRRLRATFEEAVLELRVAAALAGRRGPVAVVGLSLGALAAALAAGTIPGLALTALVAPPADLGAIIADTGIGRRYARLALRAGAPVPDAAVLREALAPFDPARRPPPDGPVVVAVGRWDRIAPPGPAIALVRAWGAGLTLHDRGHLTLLFACAAVRREVARRLAAAGG